MLCEICHPADKCTCGGCQCKWCRHTRGEQITPLEAGMIARHIASMNATSQRAALVRAQGGEE